MLALGLLLSLSLPAFASESVPPGEAEAIAKITRIIQATVRAQAKNDGIAHRDAHAKHHGCVRGTFEVVSGLKPELAVGVFSRPQKFPAWIRFSNGSGAHQNDSEGDGRGMAVKLMRVEGEKILEDEKDAQTQDFVMINNPTFFVRNAEDYVDFQEKVAAGKLTRFFFPGIDPRKWRIHELGIANGIRGKKVSSPLDTPYWSMTPYKIGDHEMKYSVQPCSKNAVALTRKGPNFLRENMKKELAAAEQCFDFLIQLRTDPEKMPIEDPTIEWSEKRSPYAKVARITIPKQDFLSAAQDDFCENLSMTPWHSLSELQPLGGINRVRKTVYQEISKLRHELNHVTRTEPNE